MVICFCNLTLNQGFLKRFRDPIRVPGMRESYHRVLKIRENRVPRIRGIGSPQIRTGFLTFSLKKPALNENIQFSGNFLTLSTHGLLHLAINCFGTRSKNAESLRIILVRDSLVKARSSCMYPCISARELSEDIYKQCRCEQC